MKFLSILALIFSLSVLTKADVLLTTGQSYVFSFEQEDLEYQYDRTTRGSVLKAGFQLAGPRAVTATYTFNLYQNSLAETPFKSTNRTIAPSDFGLTYSDTSIWDPSTNETITYWEDNQGVLELVITEGSVTLSQISAGKIENGSIFYARAIPEPSTLAFFAITGSTVLFIRRRLLI